MIFFFYKSHLAYKTSGVNQWYDVYIMDRWSHLQRFLGIPMMADQRRFVYANQKRHVAESAFLLFFFKERKKKKVKQQCSVAWQIIIIKKSQHSKTNNLISKMTCKLYKLYTGAISLAHINASNFNKWYQTFINNNHAHIRRWSMTINASIPSNIRKLKLLV